MDYVRRIKFMNKVSKEEMMREINKLQTRYERMRGKIAFSFFDDGWTSSYSDGESRLEDNEEMVIAFTMSGKDLYPFLNVVNLKKGLTWAYYHSAHINHEDRYQVFITKKYGWCEDEKACDYYYVLNVQNLSKWRRAYKHNIWH